MKTIKDFINVHQVKYINNCPAGCGSVTYNYDNKQLWGKQGIRFLKELSKELGAEVETNRNKSGIVDRGYISGFFKKNNKVVYVNISDSSCVKSIGQILFRTAKDMRDYDGGCNNFVKISEEGMKELTVKIGEMLA